MPLQETPGNPSTQGHLFGGSLNSTQGTSKCQHAALRAGASCLGLKEPCAKHTNNSLRHFSHLCVNHDRGAQILQEKHLYRRTPRTAHALQALWGGRGGWVAARTSNIFQCKRSRSNNVALPQPMRRMAGPILYLLLAMLC